MRIVSWNLNRATWSHRKRLVAAEEHRKQAWDQLAALGADLALIQEAPPPSDELASPPIATLPQGWDAEAWRSHPGPARWWCSAIASWGPELASLHSVRTELDETHPGAYRVGEVAWGDTSLVVVSLYALWDYAGLEPGEKPRYSETSLHRSISDLT